jgi:two-component system OmpR family sensor kinase
VNTRDATDLRRASVRLAVQFGAVILVLLAAMIGVTFAIVGAGQSEATTRTLVDASLVPNLAAAPHDVLLAFSANGQLQISRDAPSWFPDRTLLAEASRSGAPVQTTKKENGHNYVIRTESRPGRLVQTAVDTRENSEELGRLAVALSVAGILAAISAAIIAAIMARRAMRPMVDALALQRRFVTDASHELRTPLTLLSTRAQLLRRQVGEADAADPIAKGVQEIVQDSRELTGILEDLLISADPRESMGKVPLDLGALAREAVAALDVQASGRGVELRLTESSAAVEIEGSRISLLRLFTSLISNALDHADSRVLIDVGIKGRLAEICVQDDGPGFPDTMRDRAFERFATSRTNLEHDDRTRHYGLGLALVAEIASRHGGTITVDPSRPGEGAAIRVSLPLRKL